MKKVGLSLTLILALQLIALSQKVIYKNIVPEGAAYGDLHTLALFEMLDRSTATNRKSWPQLGRSYTSNVISRGIYTPAEMIKLAANIPLKKFNDGFFLAVFVRLKRRFGFFIGEKLTRWIEQLIASKTGDANITFRNCTNLPQCLHHYQTKASSTP